MTNTRKLTIILTWISVLLWMFLIFNLSAQPAQHSNKLSKGVTERVVETVEKVVPGMDLTVDDLNHLVRKNAHFFIYLVLALLVLFALRRSGMLGLRSIVAAIGICVLYAISDETHQLFVPGRGAQIKDVFIDSAGALVGLGIYGVTSRLVRHFRIRKAGT